MVDVRAPSWLAALLRSGKGREAMLAAAALRNIAFGSDSMRQSVEEAGALPGLVALLASDKGKEAEEAAAALSNILRG